MWGSDAWEARTAKRPLHYVHFQQSSNDLGPCRFASFSYFSSSLLALNMLNVDCDLISNFAFIGQLVAVSIPTQPHSSIRRQSSVYFASIEIVEMKSLITVISVIDGINDSVAESVGLRGY